MVCAQVAHWRACELLACCSFSAHFPCPCLVICLRAWLCVRRIWECKGLPLPVT